MTYREICVLFFDAGIESAAWDAALLIERFCGESAERVPLDAAREYDSPELAAAVKKRAERYPLQYLLGEWQFYRQTYEVSPDCLIPRSDTEILVEEAIKRLPPNALFADLCTGSGCIAISILAERPDTRAAAVEKFPKTLALAERNAVRNGVRERFEPICADVLRERCLPDGMQFDAILSNPPYIKREVLATLAPELASEPTVALDGGDDGLIFYRRIVETRAEKLKKDGFFLFEIGFDQAEDLRRIGAEAGFDDCRVIRDFGGNDRVVMLGRTSRGGSA
ncbi:MAG: peptide chain release factor N(5)-glutamine methyltransferase [Clostridia bacterium]|nr:peptide chain release factor N(5)-glutamine methyltransferase [Clostridia bacterium]